jgi:hypothetical protein
VSGLLLSSTVITRRAEQRVRVIRFAFDIQVGCPDKPGNDEVCYVMERA